VKDCIFCKINNRELPAKFVYESENIMAFADIHPKAEVHILIVPKEHIKSIRDIKGKEKLLAEVYEVIDKLVEQNNLHEDSYRVVVNGGKSQIVPHLHFHLLGKKWYKFV
jgi:histidine triad (HIT) family protein